MPVSFVYTQPSVWGNRGEKCFMVEHSGDIGAALAPLVDEFMFDGITFESFELFGTPSAEFLNTAFSGPSNNLIARSSVLSVPVDFSDTTGLPVFLIFRPHLAPANSKGVGAVLVSASDTDAARAKAELLVRANGSGIFDGYRIVRISDSASSTFRSMAFRGDALGYTGASKINVPVETVNNGSNELGEYVVSNKFGLPYPETTTPPFESLTLPYDFGVSLRRNTGLGAGSRYYVPETGADELAAYTGNTIYVNASTGNDANDGSSGAPKQTINNAVAAASDNDVISLAPGEYATPTSDIDHSVAFVRTGSTGLVLIGTFNDLSTAQVDQNTMLWNVDDVTSNTFVGFVRVDGTKVAGVRGSADALNNNTALSYQTLGIMSVFSGGTSANFSTGTAETLPSLIASGAIRAWEDASNQSFNVASPNTVYIGEGIILASNATNVITVGSTANLILDGTEVYGGSDSGVSASGSGFVKFFGSTHAGAVNDNIDYRGTVVATEIDIVSHWPGEGAASNASTGHGSAKILRVGGTYKGGSRTVHDIQTCEVINVSINVSDAFFNDQTLVRAGIDPQATILTYGDLVLSGTFTNGLVIDPGATGNDGDTIWPY